MVEKSIIQKKDISLVRKQKTLEYLRTIPKTGTTYEPIARIEPWYMHEYMFPMKPRLFTGKIRSREYYPREYYPTLSSLLNKPVPRSSRKKYYW